MASNDVIEYGKAKINLFLHVTGKRDDGYHELDSLVTFCDLHDVIKVKEADKFYFLFDGPFSSSINAADNLCVKAAKLFASHYNIDLQCHIRLEKNIPVAAGLGGGSADAAATIRALYKFFEVKEDIRFFEKLVMLGADIPVCLQQKNSFMRGVGEQIEFVDLPKIYFVLINPNKACATKEVFAKFSDEFMPDQKVDVSTYNELIDFLEKVSNQLEKPSSEIVEDIAAIKELLLQQKGCDIARLTGSGATCFGLFKDYDLASKAAGAIRSEHLDWWVVATK